MTETQINQDIAKVARDIEREKCLNIIDALIILQKETNHHHPAHAASYPQWEGRILGLEQARNALTQ